jgi:tripartite-type tricarboxylate transporter receptor subunit TctC
MDANGIWLPLRALHLLRGIMKLPHRRQFLHLAASGAAPQAVSRIAKAQGYPSRPVRIIVGYTPAGGADIFARIMGQWISKQLD